MVAAATTGRFCFAPLAGLEQKPAGVPNQRPTVLAVSWMQHCLRLLTSEPGAIWRALRHTFEMDRVAVVGSGGAGKSTFARRLGERLGLPVIHLDEHYWQPGWVATPSHEWRVRQRDLIAGERWIVDGNYSSTLDLRLARADTVIVLALPRWRCLLGVLRRWLEHHGRDVQAPGCPERVELAFLRWVWNYPTTGRARLDAALATHTNHQARIIQIRTPAQLLADPRALNHNRE